MSEIEIMRENGYALDDEKYIAGVRAAAVTIDSRKMCVIVSPSLQIGSTT